VKSRKIESI